MHSNNRTCRAMNTKAFSVNTIHFVKVAHVQQKDIHVNDVSQVGLRRVQQGGKIFQHLSRLRRHITSNHVSTTGIHCRYASDSDERACYRYVTIRSDWGGSIIGSECNDIWHSESFLAISIASKTFAWPR